jgi:hypothetical protein
MRQPRGAKYAGAARLFREQLTRNPGMPPLESGGLFKPYILTPVSLARMPPLESGGSFKPYILTPVSLARMPPLESCLQGFRTTTSRRWRFAWG